MIPWDSLFIAEIGFLPQGSRCRPPFLLLVKSLRQNKVNSKCHFLIAVMITQLCSAWMQALCFISCTDPVFQPAVRKPSGSLATAEGHRSGQRRAPWAQGCCTGTASQLQGFVLRFLSFCACLLVFLLTFQVFLLSRLGWFYLWVCVFLRRNPYT